MNNSILSDRNKLTMTSKEKDKIECTVCHKGIYVPLNPKSEINHAFTCNKCGSRVHIEANVVIIFYISILSHAN